jgi:hypothetical protein
MYICHGMLCVWARLHGHARIVRWMVSHGMETEGAHGSDAYEEEADGDGETLVLMRHARAMMMMGWIGK